MKRLISAVLGLWILPMQAFAQQNTPRTLQITGGTNKSIWQIIESIVSFLATSIGSVAIAMFVVGALMITLSGVKEDYKQKGKDLMFGSAISLAVVLGAYAIYRTVQWFLFV